VEVAMQEAVFNFVRVPTMSMYITNEPSPRVGNRLASGAIGDIYKCAPGGTNDYVYMLCTTPEMFQAMCKTIGRPDVVEDPRFKDRRERVKYIEELTRIIEDWTSQRGKHEVQQLMGAAGVPCGAILDSLELERPAYEGTRHGRDRGPSGARQVHHARMPDQARRLARGGHRGAPAGTA
jgi:formyl-CoA transferase